MRDRLDPLIEDRAKWLFRNRAITPVRLMLDWVLGYEKTLRIGTRIDPMTAQQIMDYMSCLIARDVEVQGLSNIPTAGPGLIVANHPTGIADGIVLHSILRRRRTDAFYYANSDLLKVLPQMADIIVPVEWRLDRRSHAKTRETMILTRKAIKAGRLGVLFPSGRLAKRRGLKLYERPWMASGAMIARKFGLPVIPVNIRARNSFLFYLFDALHPSLRDITLFHETLNKGTQPFRITVGTAIAPDALPCNSQDGIEMLRRATLSLGGRYAPTVSLVDSTRRPKWA
ncbi:MAG: 1-acyl-sn-glycerol-3-phosphate acyltransferase [Pseudomonadota bacterium]